MEFDKYEKQNLFILSFLYPGKTDQNPYPKFRCRSVELEKGRKWVNWWCLVNLSNIGGFLILKLLIYVLLQLKNTAIEWKPSKYNINQQQHQHTLSYSWVSITMHLKHRFSLVIIEHEACIRKNRFLEVMIIHFASHFLTTHIRGKIIYPFSVVFSAGHSASHFMFCIVVCFNLNMWFCWCYCYFSLYIRHKI